jgi:hypothetical protein
MKFYIFCVAKMKKLPGREIMIGPTVAELEGSLIDDSTRVSQLIPIQLSKVGVLTYKWRLHTMLQSWLTFNTCQAITSPFLVMNESTTIPTCINMYI